ESVDAARCGEIARVLRSRRAAVEDFYFCGSLAGKEFAEHFAYIQHHFRDVVRRKRVGGAFPDRPDGLVRNNYHHPFFLRERREGAADLVAHDGKIFGPAVALSFADAEDGSDVVRKRML